MTKIHQTYVHHGRDFDVVTRAEGEVCDALPPGVYRLNFHPHRGWWFSEMAPFVMPSKFYGNVERRAARIFDTYMQRRERGQSTGVLLDGIKGSGKTLLAKKVAVDSGLPVILINTPYTDDDFKEILANVGPCVILFDEFEKVYHEKEKQNTVLTLLDGAFASQALTFLIVNDAYKLVGPLKNRPGRLFYYLEYGGLDENFIREYVTDNLRPVMKDIDFGLDQVIDSEATEQRINGILSVAAMFKAFTFDHLQSVVEEMNRYGETAEEVLEYLNVKIPKPNLFDFFEVNIWIDGQDMTKIQSKTFKVQNKIPTTETFYIYYRDGEKDEDGDWEEHYFNIGPKNLTHTDIKTGVFTFHSDDRRVKITYTKMSEQRRRDLMGPHPF